MDGKGKIPALQHEQYLISKRRQTPSARAGLQREQALGFLEVANTMGASDEFRQFETLVTVALTTC